MFCFIMSIQILHLTMNTYLAITMEDHKKEKERNENIVPESSSEKNEQENKLVNSPGDN